MSRSRLSDLEAFIVVADEGSFTRAAARLGMSQPALSHAIRGLEARLQVRLLARTTRSVATTEAGEKLLAYVRPAMQDITRGLAEVGAIGGSLSGSLRLTATRDAIRRVVIPKLAEFHSAHPRVTVELVSEDGLTDIVAARCDAGIRHGSGIEKDMIAVRVGPDFRMAVVGAPSYFESHGRPATPNALAEHRCINYRLATAGRLYAWEFEKDGQEFEVSVSGAVIVNDADLLVPTALQGLGLIFIFENDVSDLIASGTLVRVLEDWSPTFPGYYLYHSGRRQTPPALAALIETLRYRSSARTVLGCE